MKLHMKIMTLLAFVITVGLSSLLAPTSAVASTAQTATDEVPPPVPLKKKKSTEVSFDDVLVQGKYHFSDEAVTTVEDDKILDALLGVRTDFKDRIKKSTARR